MLIQARKHMTARLPSSTSCQPPLTTNEVFGALVPDGGWAWRVSTVVWVVYSGSLMVSARSLVSAFFPTAASDLPVDPGLKQPRLHFRRIGPGIVHDRVVYKAGRGSEFGGCGCSDRTVLAGDVTGDGQWQPERMQKPPTCSLAQAARAYVARM